MIVGSLILALLPAWLLIRYFVRSDLYPEPPELIKKTFWRGVGTVIPVLIVALPLSLLETEFSNNPESSCTLTDPWFDLRPPPLSPLAPEGRQ